MTEGDPDDAPIRDSSCQANVEAEYPTCDKCGLAWDALVASPPCGAMTVGRIRGALEREIGLLEGSADICRALKSKGESADPLPALRRMAELRGVLRFVERCLGDARILDILNPNRKKRGGDGHG